jgi:hypothetical protein
MDRDQALDVMHDIWLRLRAAETSQTRGPDDEDLLRRNEDLVHEIQDLQAEIAELSTASSRQLVRDYDLLKARYQEACNDRDTWAQKFSELEWQVAKGQATADEAKLKEAKAALRKTKRASKLSTTSGDV